MDNYKHLIIDSPAIFDRGYVGDVAPQSGQHLVS